MAGRKRNPDPDTFSTTEVAEATGLSPRNATYVFTEAFAPALEDGSGSGRHRIIGYDGLAYCAIIGGFVSAGIELFMAGRIVLDMVDSGFSVHHQANVDGFLHDNKDIKKSVSRSLVDWDDAYKTHRFLTDKFAAYRSYDGPFRFDTVIEIFDRSYLFRNSLQKVDDVWMTMPEQSTSPHSRIFEWKKGSWETRFEPVELHRIGKMPADCWQARQAYLGMVRVNISLAIRRALKEMDRIKGRA